MLSYQRLPHVWRSMIKPIFYRNVVFFHVRSSTGHMADCPDVGGAPDGNEDEMSNCDRKDTWVIEKGSGVT